MLMYAKAQTRKPRSKRNKAPEKQLEKQVLEWLREVGCDVNVVEAKATFNPKIGMYLNSMTTPGMADIVGNDSEGFAIYVELKAKGKLSTLRDNQYEFLKRKILTFSFGVCIDSLDLLKDYYKNWKAMPTYAGREYLLDNLEGIKNGKEKSES